MLRTQKLFERQFERRLTAWYLVDRKTPALGWLHRIRQALGMSAPQLADRIGMTRQGVADLESREQDGSATLAALRKAAEAMNCDLVYAIVPRTSLVDVLSKQARKKATEEMNRVAHTMLLENQGTTSNEVDRLIEERADQLLRASRRTLWSGGGGDAGPRQSLDKE